ncbi:predicted protein [Postia placenta Mad-698-R]|nr:predicted protein [Postia placenta Mad-698-R]
MCKARLGLRSGATAWLEGAQACQNARPGPSTRLKPGHGSAQAQGRGSLIVKMIFRAAWLASTAWLMSCMLTFGYVGQASLPARVTWSCAGWGMRVPGEVGLDGTGVAWQEVDLDVPAGVLDSSDWSSRETSICSWVSNACSSREQLKNSSATVMGEGRGARGSFDLMSQLGVKQQGQTNTKAGGVQLGLTEAMGQEVETEVPRAAEASLYTGEDKGRLCTLVRAQLVHAQHADAAPEAVDKEMSVSGV